MGRTGAHPLQLGQLLGVDALGTESMLEHSFSLLHLLDAGLD